MNFSLSRSFKAAINEMKASIPNITGSSSKIPRKIHQLWIAPQHLTNIPGDVLPQIRAWKELHPDFEYRLWTIDEVANSLPAPRASRMMDAIRISRFEAMKADIVRLYLLSQFGGFWSDLKVCPKRRWLNDYTSKELVLVEHFKFDQLPDPTGILTNNLIGSTPANSFIDACIARAHKNIDEKLSTSVWHIAGTKIYMDIYEEFKNRNNWSSNNVILPSDRVWNELVEMGHGSYSANHLHWSVREREESIYL